MSKKTKAKRDAMAPYRVWIKNAAGRCMNCGAKPSEDLPLDIHEIPAGSHRDRALKLPWTWLVVCRSCHEEVQGIDPAIQVEILKAFIDQCINDCFGRNVL